MSLFGALNTSVTGLRAQSDALGVISDNIANVNTTGFKRNKADFASLVVGSQTETSFNPGGVQIRPVLEAGQQGVLDSSEISTDLAIEGNGFFTVKSSVGNVDANELLYTRAGNFRVNANGDLENANGFLLQGWRLSEDANGDLTPPPDLQNPASLETVNVQGFSGIARATRNVEFGANLPPNLPVNEVRESTIRVFDAEGTPHSLRLTFSRDAGDGTELPANHVRVDIHAPTLADDPNSAQSGLFTNLATSPADLTAIDLDGDGTSLDSDGQLAALGGTPTDVDLDGDGTLDGTQLDVDVNGDGVLDARFVDETATGSLNTGSLGEAEIVKLDTDGDGVLDVTLRDNPQTAADTNLTFEQTSRLSTVVEFNGDGSIRQIGGDRNAFLANTPGTTAVDPNAEGELDLSLTFNRDFDNSLGSTPGGTDATQPTQISLNLGTPRDLDLNGDGVTDDPGEANVNDRLLDGLTSFENPEGFQINEIEQDGLQFGNFTGVSVGEDGRVTANFSNGERRDIFQLPVATFNNPNGLEARSGTVFAATQNTGEVLLNQAGVGAAGTIAPAAIERSTVDLATEFTKMIETQRAYSASTRVVTASDEMLQEITNATR